MLKNNIKTNIIDEISNNKLSILCNASLMDKINSSNIRAVLVSDINSRSHKPLIYNGDIRSVSLNQLSVFEAVAVNVKDYTKQELVSFSSMIESVNASLIYLVSSVVDIVKIRSLKPQVVVINQQSHQNPVALKLNIDWNCSCLLNPLKNNIQLEYIIEYGFAGIYADRYINEQMVLSDDNIALSCYLDKLYMKKSSIRPLLKTSGIKDILEVELCAETGIDMLGFLFDNENKSNIIDMLKFCKENNKVVCLEVFDNTMLNDALSIIEQGYADCIENHTGIDDYTANSYNVFSAFNNVVNGVTPVLTESVSVIENNNITTPWLSFTESEDMMRIIKQYNVELIEFKIAEYNTKDKIKELIKKIKYKQ